MNQRIKNLIPFAVKIEDTDKSQKVIDWFNEKFGLSWRVMQGYGTVTKNDYYWSINIDLDVKRANGNILTESEFLELLEPDLPEPQQPLYNKPHPLEFPITQLSDLPEKGEMIEVWDDDRKNTDTLEYYGYDSQLNYPYLVKNEINGIESFKHFSRLPKIQISQSEINRLGLEAAAKLNNVEVSKIVIV